MADAKHRGFLDPKAPTPAGGPGSTPRIEDDPLVELARIVSESAANLSRLGAQPSEEPTLILGRATPRPAPVRSEGPMPPLSPNAASPQGLSHGGEPMMPQRPVPQPVAATPARAPSAAPAAAAPVVLPVLRPAASESAPSAAGTPSDSKIPKISEDDLLASLRQGIEPLRSNETRGNEARGPSASRVAPPSMDDDDAPTIALHLRGGASAPQPAPGPAPAPSSKPMTLEESFDDLLFDLTDRPGAAPAAGAPAAAQPVAEPKTDRPRLGDNFPRPAMESPTRGGKSAPAGSSRAAAAAKAQRAQSNRGEKEGSGRGLFFAGSALAVVVLAGLGFLGYRAFAPTTDLTSVPVIKASGKVKEEPTKQQVAAVDGGATRLSSDRVDDKTNLITKTEDPVEQVPVAPRKITPGAPGTAVPQPAGAGDQPRSVKTVVVRPDGSILQQAAPVAAPAPEPVAVKTQPIVPPQAAAPEPIAAPPAPVPAKDPVAQLVAPAPQPTLGSKTVQPQNTGGGAAIAPKLAPQPAPAKLAPAPAGGAPLALAPSAQPPQQLTGQQQPRVALNNPPPAPVAPVPQVSSSGGGDFMVQLSSQRSETDAQKAFTAAQAKFGALAGKSLDIQKADLGTRGTFYRVRVAGGSQEQAASLCSQIKSAGGDCVVTHR